MTEQLAEKPTVRQLRQARGYSNMEFCNLAGISISTLSRLENGQAISRITAGKACRALGVNIEDVSGLKITEQA